MAAALPGEPAPVAARRADAVEALVDSMARPDFGTRALIGLNRALPVAWWSVFRVFRKAPPALCALGSFEVPDISLECFRVYQTGPYRHDTALLQAHEHSDGASGGQALVTHCLADDFGAAHREQIYQRHSLSERLSVVSREPGGGQLQDQPEERGLLAINLYRHRAQARFSPSEIDTVFELAGPLAAVVRRHLELQPGPRGASPAADAPTTLELPAATLRRHCPALTERELQVCERLLKGWTFDGIAADLQLSATTVKTYRNRAFERLGIHFRPQLFALVMDAPVAFGTTRVGPGPRTGRSR